MDIDRLALEEWQKNQPLAILQLDPSDRVVLRVAGKKQLLLVLCYDYPGSLSLSQCMRRFLVNKQKRTKGCQEHVSRAFSLQRFFLL